MSEPREGSNRIKVVDRRRFDETGDLRPDRPQPEKKVVSPPSPIEADPTPPKIQEEAGAPGPSVPDSPSSRPESTTTSSPLFLELVAGLAQQAEVLMTGGQGLPAQPAEAQRVIEYLSMLEDKTRGNLSAEENQLLSNVVFQLRTLYVQNTT